MNKIANWWGKKNKNQFLGIYVAIFFQWITEWVCFYGMFFCVHSQCWCRYCMYVKGKITDTDMTGDFHLICKTFLATLVSCRDISHRFRPSCLLVCILECKKNRKKIFYLISHKIFMCITSMHEKWVYEVVRDT